MEAASEVELPLVLRASMGFDPTSQERSWERGRSLLYRVDFQDGQRIQGWWIRLELVPRDASLRMTRTYTATVNGAEHPLTTTLVPCNVTVVERGAERTRESRVDLPQSFLERGLYSTCALSEAPAPAEPRPEPSPEQVEAFVEGWLSLLALQDVIRSSDELSDVLWGVVRKPSLLGTLLSFGVRMGLEPYFPRAVHGNAGLPPPLEDLDAWTLPLAVDVNGTRALDCELSLAPPVPPLHPAGGIVRLIGAHPGEPGRRVVIELLGARGPRSPD